MSGPAGWRPTRKRSTCPTPAGCCRAGSTSCARRAGGIPAPAPGTRGDAAIVEALKRILADDNRADRGMGRHLTATPSRVGEHRREAERAVADVGGSDLDGMDDVALAGAITRLVDVEQRVSRSRKQVQHVVDSLTAEIARRYQVGDRPMADSI